MPRLDQARVEFDSRHSGHLDVGNQAGGLVETTRCEKIGYRWESFDGVTQRPHESSRIVLRFRHPDGRRFQRSLAIDGKFTRHGQPLSITEIIDLKIAIQTMIFYETCEGAPEPKLMYR
jgi:hypothetical protein